MIKKIHSSKIALCLCLLLLTAFTASNSSQNNHSYFDGYTFTLDHVLINNVETQVDLQNPYDSNFSYELPTIEFTYNSSENVLEVTGYIYCNGFNAKYTDDGTKFTASATGATLMQCTSNTNYYELLESTVLGGIQPQPISYEIATDLSGFWMWLDPNEKIYFTRDVLSVSSFELERDIEIFPTLVEDQLSVRSNIYTISKVSLYNLNGKEIFSQNDNFQEISMSQISSGLYICNVTTNKGLLSKKIVKK